MESEEEEEESWVTWMMMHPPSGSTPPEWRGDMGPVVVWRPEGAVSRQDLSLFHGFLADVKDMYSDHVPTIIRYNPDSNGYFVPVSTAVSKTEKIFKNVFCMVTLKVLGDN